MQRVPKPKRTRRVTFFLNSYMYDKAWNAVQSNLTQKFRDFPLVVNVIMRDAFPPISEYIHPEGYPMRTEYLASVIRDRINQWYARSPNVRTYGEYTRDRNEMASKYPPIVRKVIMKFFPPQSLYMSRTILSTAKGSKRQFAIAWMKYMYPDPNFVRILGRGTLLRAF